MRVWFSELSPSYYKVEVDGIDAHLECMCKQAIAGRFRQLPTERRRRPLLVVLDRREKVETIAKFERKPKSL